MAINLTKGQRINLEKQNGSKLSMFCVGCNWGDVIEKRYEDREVKCGFLGLGRKKERIELDHVVDVDVDLSCLIFDEAGNVIDYIWSPLYNFNALKLPPGKLKSFDGALCHTGDETSGGPKGLDNEMILVDLKKVNPMVHSIVFFLNIFNNKEYSGDFSGIPYAYIRMFEPIMDYAKTPPVVGVKESFAQYNVATKSECVGKRGLVLGRLYRHNGEWKFNAIGDAFEDRFIAFTIARVAKDYSK